MIVSLGLWIASGFGGRLRTEPFQNRNYATMRWFLAQVYRSAIYTFGLRIEIEDRRSRRKNAWPAWRAR